MTLCRADVLGDAALFAASGVKRGVRGEGGATPSIARSLDPRASRRRSARWSRSPFVRHDKQDRATARPAILPEHVFQRVLARFTRVA